VGIARAHLIDPVVTRWYHCITRCVRRAFLVGEGPNDRRAWIDRRLEELAQIFSIAVGGFCVMENHLHVLVRLDPEVAAGWSDEEVVRRWGRLFPPRAKKRHPMPVSEVWVEDRLKQPEWGAAACEDRRRIDSSREGMIEGFPLGSYLLLVDYTGRLFREGKAMISKEVSAILDRIGTTAETCQARMKKLSGGRLLGRFFAASRQRLGEISQRLGLRRAVNLASCLVT
jgi:hypothetical protein